MRNRIMMWRRERGDRGPMGDAGMADEGGDREREGRIRRRIKGVER